MANVFELIHSQEFASTDTIVVNHGAGHDRLGCQVVIDGEVRSDLITNMVPVTGQELNQFTLYLSSSQSGLIQVFQANLLEVNTPSAAESAALTAGNVSATNPVVSQSSLSAFALKRAAADFATFSEKASPVSADILLIEDSADSNNKKKVQLGTFPGNVFGQYVDDEESLDESSTTSNVTWFEKLSMSVVGLPSGRYRIEWFYEWQAITTQGNIDIRVQLDQSDDLSHPINPQHGTSTNNWGVNSGFVFKTLVGDHTIDIDFRSTAANKEVKMRRARLAIWRVS